MRRPYFLALLADLLLRAARFDDGLEVIEEAEALVERSGEARWHAETVRLRGALLERSGAPIANVEEAYRAALEISSKQAARQLELRASTSLTLWLIKQGDAGAARKYLAPVLEWFTEGKNLSDYVVAEQLLRAEDR